jgi:cyanate lyase
MDHQRDYGTTLKALIHEEFGDGIMSAIDFDLDLSRQTGSQRRSGQDRNVRQVFKVQKGLTRVLSILATCFRF